NNKYPFQYDGMYYQILTETQTNTRPSPYIQGQEFYIARFKISGSDVIIQDKRIEYWETKGSELVINLDRSGEDPLIGVESVQWQANTSPSDKNIVNIAWGMRSSNWSVNSSQDILIINQGLGGKFKTVNDFSDHDFDGWRVYTANGKYSNITNSVKQGGAINLTLDVLDIDNYSVDGGTTFISQEVVIVPNCEEVEIQCIATGLNPSGALINSPNCNTTFCFPVNTDVARL